MAPLVTVKSDEVIAEEGKGFPPRVKRILPLPVAPSITGSIDICGTRATSPAPFP